MRTCWDLSTRNNMCFLFKLQSHVLAALFFPERYVRYLGSFILRLRCLAIPNTQKNSFWFFWKRGLRRFALYAIVLMIFVQTFREILGDFTERKHQLFKMTLSTFQNFLFERCSAFFFGCNETKMFWDFPQISLLGIIRAFCSNAESRFSCLVFDGYVSYFRSLHLASEMSWDIKYLEKQLLFLEQNRNLPKRQWVRSENVFLSSARLDSLVV